MAVQNSKNIKIGSEIPSLTKVAYQRALDEVKFRDDSSHKDEYARSRGYDNALLSGYILSGYISHFIVDYFGPRWLEDGEISISFIKAVYQKDEVTIRGTVAEIHEGNAYIRVKLDIWMEKSNGEKVVVGSASGHLG